MKSKVGVRLRFETAPNLFSSFGQTSVKTFMFLIDKEKCSHVGDVKKKICEKFNVRPPHSITLFIDEYALISSEDVDVIRDNDEIRVVNHNMLNCIQVKTSKNNVASAEALQIKDSKRLCEENSETQLSNVNERSSAADIQTESNQLVSKDIEQSKHFCEEKSETQFYNLNERLGAAGIQSESNKLVSKDVKQSKKLKKRKKSKHTQSSEVDSKKSSVKAEIVSTPKKTKKKHKKKEKEFAPNDDLLCLLSLMTPQKDDDDAGVVTPESLQDFKFSQSEIKQDIVCTSPKKKRKHENETTDSNSLKKSLKFDSSMDMTSSSKNYDLMVTLSWPPRVGDVIAFKLLEMAEDYCPMISKFQEANVNSVNGTAPESAVLELEMLSGASTKRRSGRFEIDYDETAEETLKQVAWSRLIDPKLIK